VRARDASESSASCAAACRSRTCTSSTTISDCARQLVEHQVGRCPRRPRGREPRRNSSAGEQLRLRFGSRSAASPVTACGEMRFAEPLSLPRAGSGCTERPARRPQQRQQRRLPRCFGRR
jgi:hypothetical protein